ncbi:MAG: SMP-30/gluconolactonase/LRE family protein [Verrucomicrobia bacterium]|nr:SMP-30/gluconolactonase/LRE family protein [Verrucomicrobiota bacterium]
MKLILSLLVPVLITFATAGNAAERRTLSVGERPESVAKGWNGHYYITVMGPEGASNAVVKVLKGDRLEVFASGLDEPKGIAFIGNHLVTSDQKRVWKIDAKGRKTVLADEKDFPCPVLFLNDVCAAPDGKSVFVSDTGTVDRMFGPDGLWPLDSPQARALPAVGRIFRVTLDGKVSIVVDATAAMPCPNGVGIGTDGRLLIAEFFHGHLLVKEDDGKLRRLATGLRGADGIEQAKTGALYVSSWTQGKVWRIEAGGAAPRLLIEGLQSAADFYLDESAKLLLIPDMKAGTLTLLPLP